MKESRFLHKFLQKKKKNHLGDTLLIFLCIIVNIRHTYVYKIIIIYKNTNL